MMKRVLKWTGIVLGAVILLLIVTAVGLMMAGTARINRTHPITAEKVAIPTDEDSLARGEHLVDVYCRDCHGSDLSGQALLDDPVLGTIYATNLTGVAESHSDSELVIAIRHGMDRNGRHLMIMPSDSFIYFSEDDLRVIIAYLKTLPQTGAVQPASELRPIGRMLVGTGAMEMLFPASSIDHDLPFPEMPKVTADVSYGEYLARGCQGCHGAGLVGASTA
jgi:mono/diheme cytochrome c family protein